MKYWVEIAERLKMQEVAEHYGLRPNRAGFVCCPFHLEKTPSMKIYDKQYHCFGCASHGGIIDFVQKLFELDFKQACHKLNNDFGLGIPIDKPLSRFEVEKMKAEEQTRKLREQKIKEHNDILNGIVKPEYVGMDRKTFYKTIYQEPFIKKIKEFELDKFLSDSVIAQYSVSEPKEVFRDDLLEDNLFLLNVDKFMRLASKKYKEAELEEYLLELESEKFN